VLISDVIRRPVNDVRWQSLTPRTRRRWQVHVRISVKQQNVARVHRVQGRIHHARELHADDFDIFIDLQYLRFLKLNYTDADCLLTGFIDELYFLDWYQSTLSKVSKVSKTLDKC